MPEEKIIIIKIKVTAHMAEEVKSNLEDLLEDFLIADGIEM